MCNQLWEAIFGKPLPPESEAQTYPNTTPIRTQPGDGYQQHYNSFQNEPPSEEPSRSAQDFREQLRQRQNAQKAKAETKTDYIPPQPPVVPARPPVVAARPLYEVNLENERQQKEFEKKLANAKLANLEAENRMRLEKEENDRKADLEFQKAFDKQNREQAEEYRRAREEVEEFERETARLQEEKWARFKANQAMFIQCFLLEKHLEARQNEWATWLEEIKNPISQAKTRFGLFEKIVRSLNKNEASYQKIVSQELFALHKATLSAYDMVYEAWTTAKGLADQAPDRIFLKILQKDLTLVSNKLTSALVNLDKCMANQENLPSIHPHFETISIRDIPSTGQLQERSKTARSEDYQYIEEPQVYRSSDVEIVEMPDENRLETFF